MSHSNKALLVVIGLIIIVGGTVAFISSGGNRGDVPLPPPQDSSTPLPTSAASGSTLGSTAKPPQKADVELDVRGGGFYFIPNTVKVKKGQVVRVTYTNDGGGTHDINIDAFNVHSKKIMTGESDTMTFVADRAGTFEYYCSVGNHRNMGQKGSLTVEE